VQDRGRRPRLQAVVVRLRDGDREARGRCDDLAVVEEHPRGHVVDLVGLDGVLRLRQILSGAAFELTAGGACRGDLRGTGADANAGPILAGISLGAGVAVVAGRAVRLIRVEASGLWVATVNRADVAVVAVRRCAAHAG